MGSYLKDYRARVGNWTARTPWRHAQRREGNGQARSYTGNVLLCTAALAILLVIGSVEQNPKPVVEAENILQVMCSGCERNLKSGTQCDTCGRWFHNSCGNVGGQMADSGKWSCERCRWDRFRQLEEKLENAMKQNVCYLSVVSLFYYCHRAKTQLQSNNKYNIYNSYLSCVLH
jgi:hypothetical protein